MLTGVGWCCPIEGQQIIHSFSPDIPPLCAL
jgi:hypothetical protein